MAANRKRQRAKPQGSGRTQLGIRISERLADYLDATVRLGMHGSTPSEVVRKFIENEVERLVREGLIKITPPKV